MATSQTTPPSTDLVYTEPALTAELLDRFDTFAREVALHDGVSAFSEQTRIELTKALRERTLTPPRLFLAGRGSRLPRSRRGKRVLRARRPSAR